MATSSNTITSIIPQDVDFRSTRVTRLVSVRSFSLVFSTRLARSSIISFCSSSSFPISCPICFWRLMIEERASRPASCSWMIFCCCCRISSKPKPLVSSGSSKSQGLGTARLAPPVIRLDLGCIFTISFILIPLLNFLSNLLCNLAGRIVRGEPGAHQGSGAMVQSPPASRTLPARSS
uniref:Uncharacterized protein n=1 Tax=Sus scrofa TaxID=9823 RepID=A0A480FYJ4_PIG